jgi:hypothetical protein
VAKGATLGGINGDGMVLEVGIFNTHTKFISASPNDHLGPMAITRISVARRSI